MSNKTLIYLTVIVLAGMLALFVINMQSFISGQPNDQTYLLFNGVQGAAVLHKGSLYTLNFKQQNELIEIINRSVRLTDQPRNNHADFPIEKIIIYRFKNQAPIEMKPVSVNKRNLIFSAPALSKDYLMEISDGRLLKMLSQTYDP
ncbi:MAG: hypothetical protein LW832_09755 [Parachlamydia sp.]|jgi:hypothetical protein|nr:hypothetical protein [Parachlamydia sp.]